MIFADKLIDLRKKSGWSQEELAEKLNVSRQAVSKWEGAQSIPDMNRIIQLSELFGVSTDYLLKDNLEQAEPTQGNDEVNSSRTVSMEEANAFLATKEENSRRVALAVMLCILSPVALILLGGAQAFGLLDWPEEVAGGIGLIVLILMIIPAVALFIISNIRISRYEYLEKEPVDTLYGVTGMVRDRKERFQPVHTQYLLIGILICIASVIPLFISMFFGKESFWGVVSDASGGRGLLPGGKGKQQTLRVYLQRILVPDHRRISGVELYRKQLADILGDLADRRSCLWRSYWYH